MLVVLCSPTSPPEHSVIEVKLESYAIKPDKITVKVGQPVTLKVKNEATFIPHRSRHQGPGGRIDVKIDLRRAGKAAGEFYPTKAGSYENDLRQGTGSARATRKRACTAHYWWSNAPPPCAVAASSSIEAVRVQTTATSRDRVLPITQQGKHAGTNIAVLASRLRRFPVAVQSRSKPSG